VEDPDLVRFLRTCSETGNGRLFSYGTTDEDLCELHAGDLNEYLATISGGDFTAKDFRTWKGTCIAAWHLYAHREEVKKTMRRKQVLAALDAASDLLGNTRSVCRAHYVHPAILEIYQDGRFSAACAGLQLRRKKWHGKDEQLTLHLLNNLNSAP
jgi:DNA topoisomerase-1